MKANLAILAVVHKTSEFITLSKNRKEGDVKNITGRENVSVRCMVFFVCFLLMTVHILQNRRQGCSQLQLHHLMMCTQPEQVNYFTSSYIAISKFQQTCMQPQNGSITFTIVQELLTIGLLTYRPQRLLLVCMSDSEKYIASRTGDQGRLHAC